MLRKIMLAAVGAGALGLAAATPAQAAATLLAPALRDLPVESQVIAAQMRQKGQAAPRRAAPRRAEPRRAAPRRAAPRERWTRDRRHRYFGGFFAVPFGYFLYATHPCYDWRFGRRGWGYYWNYRRCPV